MPADTDPILRPAPAPSPESEFYWAAAREGRFELQRCRSCASWRFPPSGICPHCSSCEFEVLAASGKGTIHSFTVIHRASQRAFAGKPYVVAVIALAEGPRMISNVLIDDPQSLRCGLAVEVCFEPAREGMRIPCFRLT